MSTTLLENLSEKEDDLLNSNITVTIENMVHLMSDFSLSSTLRLDAVKLFYKQHGDNVVEVMKRMLSYYMTSNSRIIESTICDICNLQCLPLTLRLESAKDLCVYSSKSTSYELLWTLLNEEGCDKVPMPLQVSCLLTLMRNAEDKLKSEIFFHKLLQRMDVNCDYRYKVITSLASNFQQRKEYEPEHAKQIDEDLLYFERSGYKNFLDTTANELMYRILAGQILLKKFQEPVEGVLLSIASNSENNYNSRADAADCVIRCSNSAIHREHAKEIIKELGRTGEENTIYNNAQNAHNEAIEQSALEGLIRLSQEMLAKVNGRDIDFEYVLSSLKFMTDMGIYTNKTDEVLITLNRISLDRALYSNLNFSLRSALVYVVSYIMNQKDDDIKISLYSRLFQELEESANICSTGIMERIINTLSGFDPNFGLHISFEDEIMASLSGRLNSRICNLVNIPCLHTKGSKFCDCMISICQANPCGTCVKCVNDTCTHYRTCKEKECTFNEEFMNDVLEQLMIPTRRYAERFKFLLFFRTYLSEIMEDIRNDYKDHMDIATFDLYFRKAIVNYEGES